MKKIKLLLAAMAAMMAGGAYAQTDAEYADANASIQANGVYKIYTQSNGSSTGEPKYYLKSDGYLTDDASAAGQFTFDLQRIFGGHRMAGYRINRFTNGGAQNNSFSDDALKKIITTGQNRTDWEAQVFYKNGDNYAIRSTNATSNSWGASAFWTVVADNDEDGLPNATYTVTDVPFVWQLEQVTPGDYSDVTAKFITNYYPVSNSTGWTTSKDPAYGNNCAEYWNKAGASIKQTLASLPAGYYTLTAIALTRTNYVSTLYAGSYSTPIATVGSGTVNSLSQANTWFNNGNGVNNLPFGVDATSDVEIGLIADAANGDHWTVWRAFYLTYNDEPVSYRKSLAAVKATAQDALDNDDYDDVTGYERTQLTASVAKTVDESQAPSVVVAAYNALIDEINTNLSEFTAAPPYYTLLATENTKANTDFGLTAQTTTSQSAKDAYHAQMVAEYNYVTTNYNTAIDLGSWTTENAGDMTGQHWDGGSTSYNEQLEGWSGSTAWTTSYSQTIELPAGDYVFKVAGRHSEFSVLTLNVMKGETVLGTVNDFPVGDKGRGINTSGVTDFSDGGTYARGGEGGGWQWRYVPFTINEENANITISVEGSNPESKQYQWVSFCNYTVQSKPSVAASRVAYNQSKALAQAALANATYTNVGGTDRSNLESEVALTPEETIAWYDTHKSNLDSYTAAFTAGVASWNNYAYATSVVSGTLTYASTSKKSTLDAAVAVTVNTASEAATQAAAILNANRLYVESNALAENEAGAVNMTSKISSWTITDDDDSRNPTERDDQQFTQGDGTSGGSYFDGGDLWYASAYTANYKQEVTLNPGKYLLTVTSRASADTKKFELYADGNTLEMSKTGGSLGTGVFDYGWNDESLEFEISDAPKAVEIGVNIEQDKIYNWYSFSRFRLVQIEAYSITLSENSAVGVVDAPNAVDVTLNRTIKAGKWNTFCVPFNMTAEEITAKLGAGAEVKELTAATQNGGNYTMTFGTASSIVAGKPYMVRIPGESDITSITLTGKTISSTTTPTEAGGVTFTGVYTNGFAPLNSFIISNNVFYQVDTDANSDGTSEVALKAFRGYITVESKSPVKAVNFEFDDDATGINSLIPALSEGEGAIYNLAGQRMNKMQKGINIVNGKKIMK